MKKYSLVQDTISKQEIASLSKWLLKGEQLTKGKLTLEFEKQFSKYMNRKYSLFVNSGSSANLLMLSALIETNKLKNKKAIVAGVSWSTTLSPFIQNNFDIELWVTFACMGFFLFFELISFIALRMLFMSSLSCTIKQ